MQICRGNGIRLGLLLVLLFKWASSILVYKSQQDLKTYLRVSGVTITNLQEHKTTVTTASGNRYTVIELNLLIKGTDRLD
jgi:hypothetical protein